MSKNINDCPVCGKEILGGYPEFFNDIYYHRECVPKEIKIQKEKEKKAFLKEMEEKTADNQKYVYENEAFIKAQDWNWNEHQKEAAAIVQGKVYDKKLKTEDDFLSQLLGPSINP